MIMASKQHWFTVPSFREHTVRIKRSVFTCRLSETDTAETARDFIRKVSKENSQATHNCWAYVAGDNGQTFHSSDAGEPAGTAGVPMLNTLQKNQMTRTACVVTRYFGGVKLGIKGLIDAYCQVVQETIDLAPLKRIRQAFPLDIHVVYEINDIFISQLDPDQTEIIQTEYTDTVCHHVMVDKAFENQLYSRFQGYQNQGKLWYEKP